VLCSGTSRPPWPRRVVPNDVRTCGTLGKAQFTFAVTVRLRSKTMTALFAFPVTDSQLVATRCCCDVVVENPVVMAFQPTSIKKLVTVATVWIARRPVGPTRICLAFRSFHGLFPTYSSPLKSVARFGYRAVATSYTYRRSLVFPSRRRILNARGPRPNTQYWRYLLFVRDYPICPIPALSGPIARNVLLCIFTTAEKYE